MNKLLYLLSLSLVTACGQSQSAQTDAPSDTERSSTVNRQAPTEDLNRELATKSIAESKGMRFTVPYDRYAIAYNVDLLKFAGSSPKSDPYTTIKCRDLVGQVFTFEELVPRTIDGRECTLVVLTKDGTTYASVINADPARVKSPDYTGQIPGLANLSLIEKARKLLVGRRVFSLRHEAHDTDTTNSGFTDNNDIEYLPKYIPATVRTVEPGQLDLPFKITLEFSGDNTMHSAQYLFSNSAPVNDTDWRFTTRYGFSDPRERYKDLKDPVWKAIQAGSPAKGMTMKECELSMGKPSRKMERFEKQQTTEWYYEDHIGKSWNVEFINDKVEKYANYDN